MTTDAMWPRFKIGEPLYFDAVTLPAVGDDAIIEMHGPGKKASVFRVTAIDGETIKGKHFNRPAPIEFKLAGVAMCSRVIPIPEVMGWDDLSSEGGV